MAEVNHYYLTATATGASRQSRSVSNSQQGVVGRADHPPTMEKREQQIMSYINNLLCIQLPAMACWGEGWFGGRQQLIRDTTIVEGDLLQIDFHIQ